MFNTRQIPLVLAVLSTDLHVPHIHMSAVDRMYRQPYNLGLQPISKVSFTVMSRAKAVLLGRQPFCEIPSRSTVPLISYSVWYCLKMIIEIMFLLQFCETQNIHEQKMHYLVFTHHLEISSFVTRNIIYSTVCRVSRDFTNYSLI